MEDVITNIVGDALKASTISTSEGKDAEFANLCRYSNSIQILNDEIAINGLVGRIHMEYFNVNDSNAILAKCQTDLKRKPKTTDRSSNRNSSPDNLKTPKSKKIKLANPIRSIRDLSTIKIKNLPQTIKSSAVKSSTSRIIKPNRRFSSDFVLSSSLRFFAPSASPRGIKGKPKKRSGTKLIKDDDNDTVRSFLPTFDDNNSQCEKSFDETIPAKHKRDHNVQSASSRNTNIKGLEDIENDEVAARWRKHAIKYSYSNKAKEMKKQKEVVQKNLKVVEGIGKTKMNGSNSSGLKEKVKYVLIDSLENKVKSPTSDEVDFNTLVRSLRLVKLPASNWKIRIVISKQHTITEITFTNKQLDERCIKFSRTIAGYNITFGKLPVKLLGAPRKIASFSDVSVLLDIVHHLSPDDPVLDYSTNNFNV